MGGNDERRGARRATACATPVYEELVAYIPRLWSPNDYVLCGSAALAVRGVRDVADLDVQVRPKLWPEIERLLRRGHWPGGQKAPKPVDPSYEEDDRKSGRRVLLTERIDFMDAMPRIASCIAFEDVFRDSRVFGGRRVVSLRHCLAVKVLANRPKDLDDMVALATLIREEESGRSSFDG